MRLIDRIRFEWHWFRYRCVMRKIMKEWKNANKQADQNANRGKREMSR